MPWCEDCAKYWAPSAMSEAGECPTCGRVLAAPMAATRRNDITARNVDVKALAGEDAKAPWHFKLLMVLLALYLGWRVVDLFR